MSLPPELAACAALVERGDPERFAATMAAPVAARAVLWPLYALNVELARAPYASSEPMVAEMRLQWWVDQIDALARAALEGEGEVARALAPLLRSDPALAPLLQGMAEARRAECWADPFADFAEMERFIEATGATLMWAAARALGAGPTVEVAARAQGWAGGAAGWLLAVPLLETRGRQPLPGERDETIRALAVTGLERLKTARSATVQPGARPALWPAWAAGAQLRLALRDPGAVMAGRLGPSPFRRSIALGWRAALGR